MPVRIGVLGAGWVAQDRYFPSFRLDKRAELSAVYDQDRDNAAGVAARYGIPVATDSLSDFFAADLDAVAICTSPWSHSELAIEALDCGLHVLTEKPMAMNAAEAYLMAEASRPAEPSALRIAQLPLLPIRSSCRSSFTRRRGHPLCQRPPAQQRATQAPDLVSGSSGGPAVR